MCICILVDGFAGVLAYGYIGVLIHWRIATMACSYTGLLDFFCTIGMFGLYAYLCIGMLVTLVYWYIGILVYW